MLHSQVYAKSFVDLSSSQSKQKKKPDFPPVVKGAWLQENTEVTRSQMFSKERPLPPPVGDTSSNKTSRASTKLQLEDLISTDHLHLLKKKFEDGGSRGRGNLTMKEFLCFFQEHLHNYFAVVDQLHSTYMKADSDYDGVLTWEDFCTYCHAEIEPHLSKGATTSPDEYFVFPAESVAVPSNDPVNKILYLKEGNTVTCSSDGVVCVWSHDMEPRRVKKPELGPTGKPMWVTDMVLADKLRKIILSTGDNSIQFYELSNFEPYCQLSYLENLPLKLDFWCDPDDANNCILSFADDKCYLNILILPNISDDFKMWKKGIKKNNIPTCPLSNAVPSGGPSSTGLQFYRWKVHNNWITQLRYYGEVSSLFSSSNDPESSLIIGTPTGSTYVDASLSGTFEASLTLSPVRPNVAMSRQQSQQSSANSFSRQLSSVRKAAMFARPNSSFPPRKKTQAEHRVFRIAKGVSSFDYSNGYNVLVTGGMDRVVRAWNPYMTSKPVCCMYGHLSPVQSVFIAEGEERIYSVSFDNCVKVWNLLEYQCLITVIAGMHKVNMTIDVMMYNPLSKILLFGGDQLHALRQTSRVPVGEKVRSHDYPVVSVGYSSVFKQVVSVCEGSVMRVWSLETGKKVTEKENLHGNSPVTAMVLDPGERRAVTATQNGEIKIWNQNTGQCLKTLKKGNTKEVTEMCYFSVSSTAKYLVCVGWDKQLNVFQDSLDTVHQVAVPKSMWTTASRGIHKEDLTAVASGGTNFLATASFDGEIVIWSFLSGAVFSRIRPLRVPENTAHEPAEGDESVSKVMFLKSRAKSRDSADFVVGHYSGFVSFWNVYSSRKTFGCFNSTRGQPISTMVADSEETLLYVADSLGYITLFNITNYCTNGPSDSSPSVINKWRAHSKKISCLEYVPEEHLLVSSSHDGCIRLWKQHGEFIGTFGQSRLWSLQYSSSLKSPHMPEDVVLDTEGLPETHETSAEHKEEPISTIQATSFVMPSSQEESSEDMKNKKEGKDSLQLPREGQRVGKRLHNFRTRDTPQDRGGYPSYYHSLPCYSLGDDPTGKFAH